MKNTVVDDKERVMGYVVMEGEVLDNYARFEVKSKVEENRVVWTVEYEKANPTVPNPDGYAKLVVDITKALDAHILTS